jgi:hypothetical protein
MPSVAASAHVFLCIEPRRLAGNPTLVSHRGLPISPAFLRARRLRGSHSPNRSKGVPNAEAYVLKNENVCRGIRNTLRKSLSLRSRSTIQRRGQTVLRDAMQLRVGSRLRRIWVRPTQKQEPTRQATLS